MTEAVTLTVKETVTSNSYSTAPDTQGNYSVISEATVTDDANYYIVTQESSILSI